MADTAGQKDYRFYYEIRIFAVFAVALFRNLFVKFYGKEKLSAKILRIYMIELDENSQNYPSIKVRMKWSRGQFERFIARNTVLC